MVNDVHMLATVRVKGKTFRSPACIHKILRASPNGPYALSRDVHEVTCENCRMILRARSS